MFTVDSDGALTGTWGIGDSTTNGGAWTMTKGGDGTTPVPPADPRGFMESVRMPMDVGGGGGAIQVGWIALGIDLGDRVSQHWYVGASSDVELYDIEPFDDTEGSQLARLRLGGEVRYYFDDGVASASVNCGPAFSIARRTWVGARVGAESLDAASTIGEFADVSLGTTFQLDTTGIGLYGSLGVSSEPASVIPGATAPQMSGTQGIDAVVAGSGPSTPNVTSVVGTIGMIVTLGH